MKLHRLRGHSKNIRAINAVGLVTRASLANKPVRQRDDLPRSKVRACRSELHLVLEPGE
jgi:hypothetical protein